MDLLMVATELGPYVRTTEAADSIASLGKVLRQLGHDVTVCVPRHPQFEQQGLLLARRLTPLVLPGGEEVTVLDGQLSSGVRIVLLDGPGVAELPRVDERSGARQAAWFAQAAASLVAQRSVHGQVFDLVEAHDWPGALAAIQLRHSPGPDLPIVLTVHDWRVQGRFEPAQASELRLPTAFLPAAELGEALNVLKAGVLVSDQVTAISPSAFAEVVNDPLDALGVWLTEHDPGVIAIPDGIDYAVHNPAIDPLLISRYDAEDVANKGTCKTDLLRKLNLELKLDRPLVGVVGELTSAQGFDLLLQALPALVRNDLALVVAGRGEAELEAELEEHAERRPETIAFVRGPDEACLHQIYAAADLMLVAPRREPGGSRVQRAARYGAVPVAHATGAIRDLVVDCDVQLETGTGFLFDEPTPEALRAAVQRAVAAYATAGWGRLRRRVMRQDLGWDRPARRYQQVYRQAIAVRRA